MPEVGRSTGFDAPSERTGDAELLAAARALVKPNPSDILGVEAREGDFAQVSVQPKE